MLDEVDDRSPHERLASGLRNRMGLSSPDTAIYLRPEDLDLIAELLAASDAPTARQVLFKITDYLAVCAAQEGSVRRTWRGHSDIH